MNRANVAAFEHDADEYHDARIWPPDAVQAIAETLSGGGARRVVDLGAGTGLSSTLWLPSAESVVAVEPNHEMRCIATEFLGRVDSDAQVSVRDGSGDSIPVEDDWADVVACSQSLHWMEPQSTHPEIYRVLRPGGCLLAYGYTMPPTVSLRIEKEYLRVHETAQRLIREGGLWPGLKTWQFEDHRDAMIPGNWYSYIREAFCHQDLRRTGEWFCSSNQELWSNGACHLQGSRR